MVLHLFWIIQQTLLLFLYIIIYWAAWIFFFWEVGTMVLSNFQTSTKLHLFSLEVCILIVNDVCKSIHITCEKNLTSKIMFILFIQFANLFIFSFSYSGWHCESHRTSPMGFSLEWYGRWFKISLGELV